MATTPRSRSLAVVASWPVSAAKRAACPESARPRRPRCSMHGEDTFVPSTCRTRTTKGTAVATAAPELADRLEIQGVLARYAWALDAREYNRLDDVFTPDAFLDYTTAGGLKGGFP